MRSYPHTDENWRELERATNDAGKGDLGKLLGLVRRKPTGVLLVELLSNSAGGTVEYTRMKTYDKYVIQCRVWLPLSSCEERT